MALEHLITKKEQDWLFKVTKLDSPWYGRDWCLLAFFLGSPCTILELNKITISDVLRGDTINKKFTIRGDKALNGEYRIMYINQELTKLLRFYIKGMANVYESEYLFRTLKGEGFAITKAKGKERADSLTRHILDLLRKSGIEQPSAKSGRRTFSTTAYRNGIHVSVIHHLLGNKMLATTRRLIESDPLTMGEVSINAY
jgi:integrase